MTSCSAATSSTCSWEPPPRSTSATHHGRQGSARIAPATLAAKIDHHDHAVTAALADILRKQPWARRFPTSELAKFLLAAREGVLARTVRDDGSAADTVRAVTAMVSEAFDAFDADRQPPA